MSPQRTKIDFEPNIPVTMTLEFDGGKPVAGRNGQQYLYWVDGQRSMFLDAEPHQMIQQTGAVAGDTLEITKTLKGRTVGWEVVHVVDEPAPESDEHSRTTALPMSRPAPQPARSTATRPLPAGQPAPRNSNPQPAPPAAPITPATCNMLSALCSAIDALAEAKTYAERKGVKMLIDAEMIRRTATTIYIGRGEACNQ